MEVDFIVNGSNGERWAIEVKSSKTSPSELSGLRNFIEFYSDYKSVLVSLVNQTLPYVHSIDVEETLSFSRAKRLKLQLFSDGTYF